MYFVAKKTFKAFYNSDGKDYHIWKGQVFFVAHMGELPCPTTMTSDEFMEDFWKELSDTTFEKVAEADT